MTLKIDFSEEDGKPHWLARKRAPRSREEIRKKHRDKWLAEQKEKKVSRFRSPAEARAYDLYFSDRYNENHDPDNGQFASGDGGGSSDSDSGSKSTSSKSTSSKSDSGGYSPGMKATNSSADIKAVKSSWVAASPIKSIDDLIEVAPAAQKQLGDIGQRLAEKYGVEFKDPGVKTKSEKGIERTKTKIADRGGVAASVTDVVRGTFIVTSPAQAEAIAKDIAKEHELVLEDWKKTSLGYFDRAAVARFPSGITGEIQFMDAGMSNAKSDKGGNGHGLYVEWRALDMDVPEQRVRAQELKDQQVALYGAVSDAYSSDWKAAFGKAGT